MPRASGSLSLNSRRSAASVREGRRPAVDRAPRAPRRQHPAADDRARAAAKQTPPPMLHRTVPQESVHAAGERRKNVAEPLQGILACQLSREIARAELA